MDTSEGAAIVQVLAEVLDQLTRRNAQHERTHSQSAVTKFHALKPPQISVLAYLERIYKYASCSSECFVLALIYIDRLISKNNFLLTDLNGKFGPAWLLTIFCSSLTLYRCLGTVHRVLITAVMLAAKFFDDAYYNNAYYAKVGGIAVSELNLLEVEFLFRIHFQLHCPSDLYKQYHEQLVHQALIASTCSVSSTMTTVSASSGTSEYPSNTVASSYISDGYSSSSHHQEEKVYGRA